MAILLRPTCRLIHRVRQQAGSYELCVGACRLSVRRSLPVSPGSIVGARLPAKAMVLRRTCRLIHRVRQQAGSYELCILPASWRLQTLRSPKLAGVALINCRSALAREGDGAAAHLSSDPPRSPASRLLRTLHFPASRRLQTLRSPMVAGVSRINCRSALAREWRFSCGALVA